MLINNFNMKPNFLENWCKKNYPGDAEALAKIKKIGEVLDKSIDNFCRERKEEEEERKKREEEEKEKREEEEEWRREVEDLASRRRGVPRGRGRGGRWRRGRLRREEDDGDDDDENDERSSSEERGGDEEEERR